MDEPTSADVRLAAAFEQIAADVHELVRDEHSRRLWAEFRGAGVDEHRRTISPVLLLVGLIALWLVLGGLVDDHEKGN